MKQRERPSVTVDIVLIALVDGQRSVLLVRRKNPPFAGSWALPGGFVEPHEPLEAAARRELYEETGVTLLSLEQLRAFGEPGRDPRGWTRRRNSRSSPGTLAETIVSISMLTSFPSSLIRGRMLRRMPVGKYLKSKLTLLLYEDPWILLAIGIS